MFDIGSFSAQTCSGLSRRSFLRIGAFVPLAFGAHGTIGALEITQPVRAKSVLFVFLWGAPSHLDMLDPKPEAPAEYRGPFAPIETRTPGMQFTELLPRLAERSHLYTVVRTHVTTDASHPVAGTLALTGYSDLRGPLQPNFGSIISRHRGSSEHSSLPPFISLAHGHLADTSGPIKGFGGATLGAPYDPFMLSCSDRGEVQVPALRLLDDLAPNRVQDRRALHAQLDSAAGRLEAAGIERWNSAYQTAYGMLTKPEARQAFDLTREPQAVRDRYGQSAFGQSCLLARKLVEAGVSYVQVNYSQHPEAISPGFELGWDTHIYNFEWLQDLHCPVFDRAFSALLDDLHERGLLAETLVVCMGEFGRTPKITPRAARDHWIHCYPSIWAGAGIAPGRVIGASDKRGEHPKAGPVVTPPMVGTTIAELAGIHAQERAALRVLDGGSVIRELI